MISRHGEQGMFIQLLGGFRVATPTRVIADSEWRLRKNKSLIKLLALAPGHRLPREEIMDLLWPDLEPERAANNLYRALHQVRHVLEPNLRHQDRSSYLRLHNGFVLLAPRGSLWIDVETFRRGADAARQSKDPPLYEKALRLYTGDLLPEDRYDDWADGHREALKALRLALLVDLSIVREQRGEDYAAIKALQDVVGSDPAHEEAQARLMLLLAKTGHRYLALRQYHELCTALRREVDAEPELHTQALYRRIAEGSFPPTSESVS
jgi:DNA-binding SARP family transcriptional activator